MTKIFNGTPHAINIFANNSVVFDATIRKNVAINGATPVLSIPSSGMLNAQITTVQVGDTGGIPTFDKKVTGCDPLPNADIIIVSALFGVAAVRAGLNTSNVFTVADPVFSADGRTILGCLGICPVI